MTTVVFTEIIRGRVNLAVLAWDMASLIRRDYLPKFSAATCPGPAVERQRAVACSFKSTAVQWKIHIGLRL